MGLVSGESTLESRFKDSRMLKAKNIFLSFFLFIPAEEACKVVAGRHLQRERCGVMDRHREKEAFEFFNLHKKSSNPSSYILKLVE